MRKLIQDGLQVIAAVLLTGAAVHTMGPPVASQKEAEVKVEVPNMVEDVAKVAISKPDVAKASKMPKDPTPTQTAPVAPITPPEPPNNETRIWNFLIGQGFTREQTAGIMGNLQQEHKFQTSDERPNGLGIAQWIGGRANNLEAKGDYLNLDVQLNFLMEELNGVEHIASSAIRNSVGVEGATIAFQNKFERCGVCMESQRIQYAYDILARH